MAFRAISGHTHVLDLLASAASRGSLPPSLIFAGPEGVGKRLAAVALAQLLNCPSPAVSERGTPDACGVCSSCTRIARGIHADVLLVEPGESGNIKIDAIRDAVERAAYRPFEGRRRVVIIDDADAMVAEAQNALLKILEEPPPASVFALVTSRPDLLLITVRSRCQRLRFGPLAPGDVARVLITAHGFSEQDAHAAAAASDGSVGAALEGASEDFVDAREAAARLLQIAASSSDPRRRLEGSKQLAGAGRGGSDRAELARRLRALASMLRDLVALRLHADDRSLANADLKPALTKLLGFYDGDRALRAFDAVYKALDALDRNASPKIVADWIAIQV
jgi:DNA polymerase-3 subunit delta'